VTTSPAGDSLVIATRAFFPIRGRQFMLTILWDASDLQRVLSTVPAGPDHRVRVTSARGTLVDGSRPGAPSGEDQQTVRVPFHHLSADLTISASTGPLTTPIRHLVLLLLAAAILIVILPAAIALGRSRRRA
jgi:hypothetical protein